MDQWYRRAENNTGRFELPKRSTEDPKKRKIEDGVCLQDMEKVIRDPS
jgi:hypothetical protein